MFFFPVEVNFHLHFNAYFFTSVSTTFYFRSFQPRFYEFIKFRVSELGGGFNRVNDFNKFASLAFPTSFFNPTYFITQTFWDSILQSENFEDVNIFFKTYNAKFKIFCSFSFQRNFVDVFMNQKYYPLLSNLIVYDPNELENINFNLFPKFTKRFISDESYIIGDVADITFIEFQEKVEEQEYDDIVDFSDAVPMLFEALDTESLETVLHSKIFINLHSRYTKSTDSINFCTHFFDSTMKFRTDFPKLKKKFSFSHETFVILPDFNYYHTSFKQHLHNFFFKAFFRNQSAPSSSLTALEGDYFTTTWSFRISENTMKVQRHEWDFEKSGSRSARFTNFLSRAGTSSLFKFHFSGVYKRRKSKYSVFFRKFVKRRFNFFKFHRKRYFSGAFRVPTRILPFYASNCFRFLSYVHATTRFF